jgi:hypothetical protein
MTIRILALAAMLVLMLPGATFAASATSDETLTVESSVTMTGVPATIDYGSAPAGTRLVAAPFTISASTNSPTGATLSTNGLSFDVGGGFDSFGANARLYHVDELQAENEFVAYDADDTAFQDIDVGTWAASPTYTVTLAIDIPPTTYPTTVTSSVTFTYEVNPTVPTP